jgi:glycosyltransferase involved in cell wall biosynthesis
MKMWSAVDKFRAAGGLVCAVLYDLIPFTHPQTVQKHTLNAHTLWWKQAPLHLDSVMCISQTVRDEFLQWQDMQQLAHQLTPDQVGYFYLGSELSIDSDDAELPAILLKNEPFFLLVGSIEPRKNYQLVLDAFEHLWREGKTTNLVIVGGHGWKSEAFLNRLQTHPLYKKRIFLLTRTTDGELALLYRKTAALIIASVAEGFGLPIVEAFQHGAKVICSDIPVFREIATDRAVFFDVSNSRELADRVSENLCLIPPAFIIHSTLGSEWLTWPESATQLFTRLFTCMGPQK